MMTEGKSNIHLALYISGIQCYYVSQTDHASHDTLIQPCGSVYLNQISQWICHTKFVQPYHFHSNQVFTLFSTDGILASISRTAIGVEWSAASRHLMPLF